MKRTRYLPLVILLSLGGCVPNTNDSSLTPDSREKTSWSEVKDSDKAFDGFGRAIYPYILDNKVGYYFQNGNNNAIVTLDFETDEDYFSSSLSSAPSKKDMKDYTVELYGIGETAMLNCNPAHDFKASTTFDASKMAIISEGEELTSIKQLFKTNIAETKISEDPLVYEQGLYTDLSKAAMSKFLFGQLLGQDDGIQDKTFIDVSSIFPDSFVFSEVMEEALAQFIDALKDLYEKGKVSILTNGENVYDMEIRIADKNDFGNILRDIAREALDGFSNPLVSGLSFDTYIDSVLEGIDSLNGSLKIRFFDGEVYGEYGQMFYESDMGLIEYDFNAKLKNEEPSPSSSEESSQFNFKSICFDGDICLIHGDRVRDDMVPDDLLNHEVWKELEL
ncbi:MAG: hypothetical protein IKN69_03485 [Bacilli bacterium]|nr:hypothetical protein [Bacilli bacterium]